MLAMLMGQLPYCSLTGHSREIPVYGVSLAVPSPFTAEDSQKREGGRKDERANEENENKCFVLFCFVGLFSLKGQSPE